MDFSEATTIVYDRIQKLEPDNVSKIIGYVLLQDNGEGEMIRLACGPESSIQSLIMEAKSKLGLSNPIDIGVVSGSYPFPPYSPGSNLGDPCWDAPGLDLPGSYFCPKPPRRISSSPPQYPVKICHYFLKGFCKHGNNCRYFHPPMGTMAENFPQHFSLFQNDPLIEDHGLSRGSLEKLELEITELLKSRGGSPVSIASLPMLYFEKYGRTLQAEGYLTESQRHGKVGFSLSKLLARLKKSIRLIDRPHGQHSVILAEDFQKFLDYDRNDPMGIASASRQIYLTFPAESTFTEQDVSSYFNKFGPVQDVRIPCQQKRMFGFVTFVFMETAKQILAKGNPHFICGARVLVKPYKEKSRLTDRKYAEKMQSMACYNQRLMESDSEIQSMPRFSDVSRFLMDDMLEEHEYTLELERRRLAELQVASKSLPQYTQFGYLNPSEVRRQQSDFSSLSYLFDVVNNGSSNQGNVFDWTDQDSIQGINLPESPFASGISTVT